MKGEAGRQKKVKWLFQGPESDSGQTLQVPGICPSVRSTVSHTALKHKPLNTWWRSEQGAKPHEWLDCWRWGLGDPRRALKDNTCYRIYLQVATAVTHVAAWGGLGVEGRWRTAWTQALTVSGRGTQESRCFLGIVQSLHHMKPETQSGKPPSTRTPYSWDSPASPLYMIK